MGFIVRGPYLTIATRNSGPKGGGGGAIQHNKWGVPMREEREVAARLTWPLLYAITAWRRGVSPPDIEN